MIKNKRNDILIDLIKEIEDPEIMKKYLDKLKEEFKPIEQKEVMDLFGIIKEKELEEKQKADPIYQLRKEMEQVKIDIKMLQAEVNKLKEDEKGKAVIEETDEEQDNYLNEITHVKIQKWYIRVNLIVKDQIKEAFALVDSGADMNCIPSGMFPLRYCEKTSEMLYAANSQSLKVRYKISKVHICQENICFRTTFIVIKDIQTVILGTPFTGSFRQGERERDGIGKIYNGKIGRR